MDIFIWRNICRNFCSLNTSYWIFEMNSSLLTQVNNGSLLTQFTNRDIFLLYIYICERQIDSRKRFSFLHSYITLFTNPGMYYVMILTLIGWISAYGGLPSAISIAVIPKDHTSARQSYPISWTWETKYWPVESRFATKSDRKVLKLSFWILQNYLNCMLWYRSTIIT